MEEVAKVLLSGLIFQQGVPLIFVKDEEKEFVDDFVHHMNRYFRYQANYNWGHKPRSRSNV